VGQKIGAAKVPGHAEYADFMATTFMQSYIRADGGWAAVWLLWGWSGLSVRGLSVVLAAGSLEMALAGGR
jgi:hypothetical protein